MVVDYYQVAVDLYLYGILKQDNKLLIIKRSSSTKLVYLLMALSSQEAVVFGMPIQDN